MESRTGRDLSLHNSGGIRKGDERNGQVAACPYDGIKKGDERNGQVAACPYGGIKKGGREKRTGRDLSLRRNKKGEREDILLVPFFQPQPMTYNL